MEMRVLLVEADDSTRHIVGALLRKCSYKVPIPLLRHPSSVLETAVLAKCDECNKDVPVALITFHNCSLDAKIKMNLGSLWIGVVCFNLKASFAKILSSDDVKFGYNAATDRYEDLMAARIIDPSKVVRCCLEHAVSVARTFLIADAVVVEIKEPMPKLPRFMKNPMPTSGVGPLNPLGDQNKRINPSSFLFGK
ncbi:hypothetical protein CASFOL_004213 [Castilleja foliolosa]|uniref:Uncharacterized protein n=1 Tax=Castilleja foliolosa TaxID=1961234 RepID=A0ABD3EAK1_9LAMI